jgi:hypothetical protein
MKGIIDCNDGGWQSLLAPVKPPESHEDLTRRMGCHHAGARIGSTSFEDTVVSQLRGKRNQARPNQFDTAID